MLKSTESGKMAFESRKLGFVSLEAEYVSTQENLPCVSLPLLTMCVSFLLSAVCALHLLLTLTHLLSKGNGCVPGFQSAMEKDGIQRSLASSHNPLLQMNSKSQKEDFLQEGKTHRQKPGELRRRLLGSHRSCTDCSNLVCPGRVGTPSCFCVELRTCLTMGKEEQRETTPRLWLSDSPHTLTKPSDTSHYTPWGVLNT